MSHWDLNEVQKVYHMQTRYTQLTGLLNKPLKHPDFAQAIETIGKNPVVDDRPRVCFYDFFDSGLQRYEFPDYSLSFDFSEPDEKKLQLVSIRANQLL
jgi:hypothetical protein